MKIRPVGAELFPVNGQIDIQTDSRTDSCFTQFCGRLLKIQETKLTQFK